MLKGIKNLLKDILEVEKEILHEVKPNTKTLILQFKTGDKIMADLSLKVGQTSILTMFPGEADGVTVTPGATLSGQTVAFTDPSCTVVKNPDGTFTFTAVAPTTADASGSANASATDADGTVTPVSKAFTVSVAAATARTSTLILSFSAPATAATPTGTGTPTPAQAIRTPAPGVATS